MKSFCGCVMFSGLTLPQTEYYLLPLPKEDECLATVFHLYYTRVTSACLKSLEIPILIFESVVGPGLEHHMLF